MDYKLTKEQQELKDWARDFAREKLLEKRLHD